MKKIMGDQLHYLHCGDSITLDSKKKKPYLQTCAE
jgi:hypothetical protein